MILIIKSIVVAICLIAIGWLIGFVSGAWWMLYEAEINKRKWRAIKKENPQIDEIVKKHNPQV